ncbi:MAG: Ig-like domain-containing protein [Gemmataceae bacterium]|nr:Ig-like domain-containing protein [Gemmataceae bacterium]
MDKFRTRLQVEGLDQRWLPSAVATGSTAAVATALMSSRTSISLGYAWPTSSETPASVTLTARVGGGAVATSALAAATPVGPTPTGSVKFYYDGAVVGTATLDGSGTARLTRPGPTPGRHPVMAEYQGDVNYAASTSGQAAISLNQTTDAVVDSTDWGYGDGNVGGTTAPTGGVASTAAAPPPAPPTSDTLTWDNFTKLAAPPADKPYAAFIGAKNDLKFSRQVTTTTIQDETYLSTAEARVKIKGDPAFKAVFNKAGSFIVRGKETDSLLAHEKLHLAIAEYVATKAAANFPETIGAGSGSVQGTKDQSQDAAALNKARAAALKDFNTKIATFRATWDKLNQQDQDAYDAETKHGVVADAQDDWAANYQAKADVILKAGGWTK